MDHCIVNGKRCSKCCEVLTMKETKSFREWRNYVKKYGIPDGSNKQDDHLFEMVRPISKRRTKKLNPHLVSVSGNNQSYFTCIHFTGSGCDNYKNRPSTCHKYPYYGKSQSEWFESPEYLRGGLYDKDCTFYIKIT